MTLKHAGRIAATTGGARGIGQAIVQRLATEGARVAIADLTDGGESVARVQAAGGEAAGLHTEVADWGQMCAFGRQVRARFGDPSILIHCAALQFMSPFDERRESSAA